MIANLAANIGVDPTQTVQLRREYRAGYKRRLKQAGIDFVNSPIFRDILIGASDRVAANDEIEKVLRKNLLTGWTDTFAQRSYLAGQLAGKRRAGLKADSSEIMADPMFKPAVDEEKDNHEEIALLLLWPSKKNLYEKLNSLILGAQSKNLSQAELVVYVESRMQNAFIVQPRAWSDTKANGAVVGTHGRSILNRYESDGITNIRKVAEAVVLSLADLLTAQDNNVCTKCLGIESGNPYTIAWARSNPNPQHDGCRCSWWPFIIRKAA